MRDWLKAHLFFKGARMSDLRVYNRYLANEHLRIDGSSGVLSGDVKRDAKGEIGSGSFRVNGEKANMRVAAEDNAGVTMKDVGFLLSLVSREKKCPKWVFKRFDGWQAGGQGRVQRCKDT
ncbi:MAG: hypothetical protein ABI858_06125 [Pseudoxanthomonas sp.]